MRKHISIILLLAVVDVCLSSVYAQSFKEYLVFVREKAIEAGISEAIINQELFQLKPDPRVLALDRKQPEFIQTTEDYLKARLSDKRISDGRNLRQMHNKDLLAVERTYKVDANYIVAFWGLETNFGRYQGKYSVIRSLATLGHDPRRNTFFTRELISALKILDEGHVKSGSFVGAWAGAMGQSQFMPSSFLNYAVDYDKDKIVDIWNSHYDIFASIANYLKSHGWKKQTDIIAVDLIKDLDSSIVNSVIYTDITKDGSLKGVSIDQTVNFAKSIPHSVIASGGVSSLNDISRLAKEFSNGVQGVIVGQIRVY